MYYVIRWLKAQVREAAELHERRRTATKAPRRTKLLKQTKAAEPHEGAKAQGYR